MYRSNDARGLTLVELVVAMALGAVVLGGAAWYFTAFRSASDFAENRANDRIAALQAGALAQAILARRNVTLDRAGGPGSVVVEMHPAPALRIRARRSSASSENRTYLFHNVCRPRPTGAPTPPSGPLGRCPFPCARGEAASVALTITDGGTTQRRLLVEAAPRLAPGAAADAVLCIAATPSATTGLPEISFEIVTRPYGPGGRAYGPSDAVVETLATSVRDDAVELTGHD